MNEKEAIKNLKEIIDLSKEEIENNDKNTIAILDITDLKNLAIVLKALEQKDKELAEERIKYISSNLNNTIKQRQKEDKQLNALNEGWKIELEQKDKEIQELKEDKKLIGQIIDEPEECWFDEFEVKVIKNNKLYGVATREDFVNLKQISDEDPENCITVIAESALSGAIYRYNNYNNKEWQLVGTMLGYA